MIKTSEGDLAIVLACLEGRIGSNPKIVRVYPSIKGKLDDIIPIFLPYGAKPDMYYEGIYENQRYFTLIYEIAQKDSRSDLVSFSIVNSRNQENNKLIIKELISKLKMENLFSLEVLSDSLPAILEGVQNESTIKFERLIFDIQKFLELNNLKSTKNVRKVKGALV